MILMSPHRGGPPAGLAGGGVCLAAGGGWGGGRGAVRPGGGWGGLGGGGAGGGDHDLDAPAQDGPLRGVRGGVCLPDGGGALACVRGADASGRDRGGIGRGMGGGRRSGRS